MITETTNKDIDACFPFPSYRAGQREALIEAIGHLTSDKDVVIEAPTGTGKSGIAVALAHWSGSALLTTPLNTLINQYATSFPRHLSPLMGRNNYPCNALDGFQATAASGLCKMDPSHVCGCPYADARAQASGAPIVLSNLAMAALSPTLRQREWPLLIVDEGHNLESAVIQQTEAVIPSGAWPSPPPATADWPSHRAWLTGPVRDHVRGLSADAQARMDGLLAEGDKATAVRLAGEQGRWDSLLSRISWMDSASDDGWTVQHTGGGRSEHLQYRPVSGVPFLRSRYYSLAERVVVLSATPPSGHELGLDDAARVIVPMSFPVRHRPVFFVPRASLAYNKRSDAAVLSHARLIAERHSGRTLVHAHSYVLAERLHIALRGLGVACSLQDPRDRAGSLERWTQHGPNVFVSVNMTEGLDLEGDLCRSQFLVKVPWPDLSDPWVKARNERFGEGWMAPVVARTIVQAYGRAVRNADDKAVFVVTDPSFQWFYARARRHFPQWFQEAVRNARPTS